MPENHFTTPAILLKRVDFGDDDLILTVLSPSRGKISLMAKSARKSRKRFCGALDLFSVCDMVCSAGKGSLPLLREAALRHPFSQIRSRFKKTAYASYFAEVIHNWMEPDAPQPRIFSLLYEVLDRLDRSQLPEEVLSIVFQMTLMIHSGFSPDLTTCCHCHTPADRLDACRIGVHFARGGLICADCHREVSPTVYLSLGTVKHLLWMGCGDWNKIARVRLSEQTIRESLSFLEAFVPFHLGKEPKSLAVLRQFRSASGNPE